MSQKPEWHILTVTRGGSVSLLKNLTEDVARQTMQRLRRPGDDGDPWSNYRIVERLSANSAGRCFSYHPQPGDLEKIECFGPEGEQLEVWPKPSDYEGRLERAKALMVAHSAGKVLAILSGCYSDDQSAPA